MGGIFGGGSAQATVTNQANISYTPYMNLGDGNTSSNREWFSPTATTSPKLDESMTASVGVGVAGGSGSGGAVRRSEDPYITTDNPTPAETFFNDEQPVNLTKYLPYALGFTGLYIVAKALNKKTKKA